MNNIDVNDPCDFCGHDRDDHGHEPNTGACASGNCPCLAFEGADDACNDCDCDPCACGRGR